MLHLLQASSLPMPDVSACYHCSSSTARGCISSSLGIALASMAVHEALQQGSCNFMRQLIKKEIRRQGDAYTPDYISSSELSALSFNRYGIQWHLLNLLQVIAGPHTRLRSSKSAPASLHLQISTESCLLCHARLTKQKCQVVPTHCGLLSCSISIL